MSEGLKGKAVERKLAEVVVRHCEVRRGEEIFNACGLFWLGEYSRDSFVQRIEGIFIAEKEMLTSEEIIGIRSSADAYEREINGTPV